MKRPLAMFLFLAGAAACSSIVSLEVTPASAEADEQAGSDTDDAAAPVVPSEAGTEDAGEAGEAEDAGAQKLLACDCPQSLSCCIAPGTGPTCVARDAGTCAGEGALLIGCTESDEFNGRTCCWNEDGPPRSTSFGSCAERRVCRSASDCPGSTCATVTCGATTLGICAPETPPVCPP